MRSKGLLQICAGAALILGGSLGWSAPAAPCANSEPPSLWVVKSPYPFQNGSERTFDELYHGPWKARVDIVLYARPNSRQVVGNLKAGTVVDAVLGKSIVSHPLRFVASQDYKVVTGSGPSWVHVAKMPKGDPFWILNLTGEGGFAVWWRCRVVGWDSTDASTEDPNRLDLLGTNEERWVKVRDRKSGLSGWFHDNLVNQDPQLVPAHATTKSIGE